MSSSFSSRILRKFGKTPKHDKPAFRHITATIDDITLEFPAEIEYRLDTLASGGTCLSVPERDQSTTHEEPLEFIVSRQKTGWTAESGQDWYLSNFSVRAGSIGACVNTVSELKSQRKLSNIPIPSGDVRDGTFSGPWIIDVGQDTRADDATSFHPTERKYFERLQEDSGKVYRLVGLEMGDYCEAIDPGDQGTLNSCRDVSEAGDRKTAIVSKRYEKARWSFRAQLSVPTEGNIPDNKRTVT
ncbi:hypothetical protein IAR50_006095 [Cryptococcus sp. DSM 104548]